MTCILTWNKHKWPEEKLQELMDRFHAGSEVVERWKFGAHKKFGKGERVYLSRTGKDNPGLIGAGYVDSDARQEPDFEDLGKLAWYVDIKFDYLSRSAREIVATHQELSSRLGVTPALFTPQKSGYPYTGDDLALDQLWLQIIGEDEIICADEVKNSLCGPFKEGSVREVKVNRYERDPQARKKCIEIHGVACKACRINLAYIYGPTLAKGYIHVHHIVPLKDIGQGYEVDPVNHLVPLCPNCHAMVHQVDPPLSVDDLVAKIMPRYLDLFK